MWFRLDAFHTAKMPTMRSRMIIACVMSMSVAIVIDAFLWVSYAVETVILHHADKHSLQLLPPIPSDASCMGRSLK